jgi:CheY-like chemotaxis protein
MTPAQPAFLYVDDDELSREVVYILLTMALGFSNVTIFEDSTDFAERLRALPVVPDIIFLDIQMHPFSGYEVLHMVRNEPSTKRAKVVALTASVMAADVEHLRAEGFDGLIGKPIKQVLFTEGLNKLLAGEEPWIIA